eukprot:965398_1
MTVQLRFIFVFQCFSTECSLSSLYNVCFPVTACRDNTVSRMKLINFRFTIVVILFIIQQFECSYYYSYATKRRQPVPWAYSAHIHEDRFKSLIDGFIHSSAPMYIPPELNGVVGAFYGVQMVSVGELYQVGYYIRQDKRKFLLFHLTPKARELAKYYRIYIGPPAIFRCGWYRHVIIDTEEDGYKKQYRLIKLRKRDRIIQLELYNDFEREGGYVWKTSPIHFVRLLDKGASYNESIFRG